MDRSSRLAETHTPSKVGGLALIVGAACFTLFWTLPPTSPEPFPRLLSLALHGASIVSLAIGLGLLARAFLRSAPPQPVAAVGAVLAAIGSFAFFPFFSIGLGLVAIGLLRTGHPRPAVGSLAIGAATLLFVIVGQYLGTDGQVFGDDVPPFPVGLKMGFQASVILVGTGLVAVGLQLRRRTE